MAPHSSTPACKIPWMEEPGGLQSMGLLQVSRDWATSLSRNGEGNGNPLQCSCLDNPRDSGAWWAAIYGVAESWTRLKRLSSNLNFTVFVILSTWSWLVHGKAIEFYTLTLYLENLISSLTKSRNFLLIIFEFSTKMVMSSVNKDVSFLPSQSV